MSIPARVRSPQAFRKFPVPPILLLFGLLLGLYACAGRRTAPIPPPAWPAEVNAGRIFYAPKASSEAGTVLGTLDALAPKIRVPGGAASRVRFAADRGRLRVHLQWRQAEYREIENPLAYNDHRCQWDFFCDSPWPQLERVFVPRDATALLDPSQMTDIALFTDGRVVAAYETPDGPQKLALAVDDAADQRTLADALAALAAANGVTLPPGPAPAWAALTPGQTAWLGLPKPARGILVLSAPAGSAPARAGLAYPDVILSVGGRSATTEALRAVTPGTAIRALRWTARTISPNRSVPRLRTLDLVWPDES